MGAKAQLMKMKTLRIKRFIWKLKKKNTRDPRYSYKGPIPACFLDYVLYSNIICVNQSYVLDVITSKQLKVFLLIKVLFLFTRGGRKKLRRAGWSRGAC